MCVFGEVKLWDGLKFCCMVTHCAGGLDLITQIRLVGVMISLLLFVVLQNLPYWHCESGKWSQSQTKELQKIGLERSYNPD